MPVAAAKATPKLPAATPPAASPGNHGALIAIRIFLLYISAHIVAHIIYSHYSVQNFIIYVIEYI